MKPKKIKEWGFVLKTPVAVRISEIPAFLKATKKAVESKETA